MLCPKCRNNVTGKWCVFCGANLSEGAPASHSGDTQQNSRQNSLAGGFGTNNTEDMYRDDVYSGDSRIPEEGYYQPEDAVDPYSSYYDQPTSGNKGKIIAVVTICMAILIVGAIVLFKFAFTKDDSRKSNSSENNSGIVQSDSDNKVKSLTKQGQKLMSQGDYEDAEDVYSELSELTNDKEANTIYEILYNYNRGVKRLNDGDCEAAEKFYNKIPLEYVDYDICTDVDKLDDNIQAAKKASQQLEKLSEYLDEEDLVSARELIGIIDSTYLSPSQRLELNNLSDNLSELEKQKQEEEERKKQEEEERKRLEEEERKRLEEEERKKREEELANKPSGYGHLSNADAQSVIYNYCDHLVRAINSNDFNIVAPYIYSSSPLYTQQIKLINSCVSQGITERFDGVTLNSLTKLSDTKWEAKVTESETMYYADGSQKSKTFYWTYTIEYIGGQFYLTAIR